MLRTAHDWEKLLITHDVPFVLAGSRRRWTVLAAAALTGAAVLGVSVVVAVSVSRLYLQVPEGTKPEEWTDGEIWAELSRRLEL